MQSYNEVLSTSEIVKTGPEVAQTERVVGRLAKTTEHFSGKSVSCAARNRAFCLPGGKIVVYTGILPLTQTDDGLATVLGHEMAHATSRHGSQRLLQQSIMQTAMVGASFSPEFMSTRPSHGTRINRLQQEMPKAIEEYEKSPMKRWDGESGIKCRAPPSRFNRKPGQEIAFARE